MKSFRVPSAGAANIYTASLYMAWPMGFRMWAASSSGRMLEGCGVLPFDSKRALPSCIDGRRAAPAEDCAGAWDYLKRLHWHRSHLPIDEILIMVEAVRRILDSDGDRHAIADPDERREAPDRVQTSQ